MAKGERLNIIRHKTDDPTELFNEVATDLGIDDCRLERHPITGRLEYISPEGKLFEIGGEFYVFTESNDGHHLMNPPQESLALRQRLEADQPELYREDEDHIYDWYEPRHSFSGQRLSISLNGIHLGEPWYPYQLAVLSQHQNISISVAGPIDAHDGPGLTTIRLPTRDSNGVVQETEYCYVQPHGLVYWEYEYTVSDLERLDFSVVDGQLQSPDLKLLDYYAGDDELWLPTDGRPTSETYSRIIQAGYGRGFSELERIDFMRQRRLMGIPLGDDPLRDLVIISGRMVSHLAVKTPEQPDETLDDIPF